MTLTLTTATRVNLGSGKFPLDGWTNVDQHCPADVIADFRELNFHDLEAVRMSHLLEHISWRQTVAALKHVHGWLCAEGSLEVEVPDMDRILALGTTHPLWFKYVYGDQSHEGEYHQAGFTMTSLARALADAGFRLVRVRQFDSVHPGRETMPCLTAWARA